MNSTVGLLLIYLIYLIPNGILFFSFAYNSNNMYKSVDYSTIDNNISKLSLSFIVINFMWSVILGISLINNNNKSMFMFGLLSMIAGMFSIITAGIYGSNYAEITHNTEDKDLNKYKEHYRISVAFSSIYGLLCIAPISFIVYDLIINNQ